MRPAAGLVVLLAISSGCDAASGPATVPPAAPAPSVALTATSSQLEVALGQVQLVVVSAARAGGYSGDVQFVVDSVPTGMRAQASALITANGVTSALLAVAVDPTVAVGSYNLGVRAIAFGLADVAVPLAVVVEPAGTPAYTLETRPIVVARGASIVVPANIDRGGNTRDVPVSLSAEKLPTGVSVTLYPVTNAKALSNMTVLVGSGVAPGQYSITIRGVTGILDDRMATIPLVVLPN